MLRRTRDRAVAAFRGPLYLKETREFAYWKRRHRKEAVLRNAHYEHFYTTHFRLGFADYRDARVLDLGCGPRGSLEWASMTRERVGLDPLADSYRALGTDAHEMDYVAAPAEAIPFPDGHFDIVASFNSLDHVADLDRTIAEIERVVRAGGRFLLLTEVDHAPTPCEPITFSWDIVERFAGTFELEDERRYEACPTGVYDAVRANVRYDADDPAPRSGWLSARFRRR